MATLETIGFHWQNESIAVATLNRPDSANTISTQLAKDLHALVDHVRFGSEAKVLVITGAGKHFCAGADLKERGRPTTWLPLTRRAIDALGVLPVVTIAAINGSCMGGGLELALACDFRIAARSAKLGLPEISFGMLPAAGGPQRLARLIGSARAKWLVMTGERLTADEAALRGIVDESIDDAHLLGRALEIAASLAVAPAYALRTAKAVIERGMDTVLERALATEYSAIDGLASPEERAEEIRKASERSATYSKIFAGGSA